MEHDVARLIDAIFEGRPARLRCPALDVLETITVCRILLDRAEAAWVPVARQHAATWAEIGHALALSRQAAQRRHASRLRR